MREDRLLIRELHQGSRDALRAIYEKYERFLLTIAANLLDDTTMAGDAVQDVFVSFARSARQFHLRGSLRAYLATCVANRARDYMRRKVRHPTTTLAAAEHLTATADSPVEIVIRSEELERVSRAVREVPYEQREAIVLRLHGNMKFREIADVQGVSVRTALSRYRYGLDKLRALLNGEVGT